VKLTGAFRLRLYEAWLEMKENFGRSILQALGVTVGVAAVLGGFSISDSQRKRADEMWVKHGGIDKLTVQPSAAVDDGQAPSALQMANLGLRSEDAAEGEGLGARDVAGVSEQKTADVRVRSAYADQARRVTGVGGDYLALEGYDLAQGRAISKEDVERGAAVAVLGAEAVSVFFPTGEAVGQTIRIGDQVVTVVGVLEEMVFRFRGGEGNILAWRNQIVAVPATLVSQRMQGDAYRRVDRITFKIPVLSVMERFTTDLGAMLRANHRQQEDYRLDDVGARIRKRESQGQVYDLIFMLSGVLSLLGGGMVNVNIQLASLKDRIREVGVKMAIGASGLEVFKQFMTEALVLTTLGGVLGLGLGVLFSWAITSVIDIPLHMNAMSFVYAYLLASAFGFVFALFPAWRASRLSPLEALRYE
jgi:ABC-type antimicrobial peptide transport system permease subunit